jgi:hypothetical protein
VLPLKRQCETTMLYNVSRWLQAAHGAELAIITIAAKL